MWMRNPRRQYETWVFGHGSTQMNTDKNRFMSYPCLSVLIRVSSRLFNHAQRSHKYGEFSRFPS